MDNREEVAVATPDKQAKEEKKLKKIKEMLTGGEEIIHTSYVHWAVFLNAIFLGIIAVILGVLIHPLMSGVIAVIAFYPALDALIRFKTTRLVVTNKRVIAKYGFFSKDSVQIKLTRIESAHREEPFIGQFLGYSTVIVQGTGTGAIPIRFVKDGREFVKNLETLTLGNSET
jgi:uncharacterized membrane protein YdbT with pleckstrin-like domain